MKYNNINQLKRFSQLMITNKVISSMRLNRCYELYQLKLNRFIKDLESNIGRRLLHDAIIMEGFLDIVNGDTVIHGKNSVVDQGLAGITNWISGQNLPCSANYFLGSYNWTTTSPGNTYMVIGSDTTHGTSNGTTTLQSPIGSAPGTLPNSQTGSKSNPSTGVWQIQWTATWNSGIIPANATLGEVGLYLWIIPGLQGFQTGAGGQTLLFSRMASADGKFTQFTINNAVPLSIAWNFRLTYST